MTDQNQPVPLAMPGIDFHESLDAIRGWVETYVLNWGTLIEASVLVVAILAAFFLHRQFVPRLDALVKRDGLSTALRMPLRRVLLVVGPGAAALLAWIGYRTALVGGLEGELLRVAANLLTAWVAIRVLTSFLRQPGWSALITIVVWFAAALAIVGWLGPSIALLNGIAFHAGELRISLMGLINAVLVLVVFLWASGLLVRLIEDRMTRLEGVTPAARVLVVKMLRILLYVIAVVVALTSIGLNLTALAVFSGALGIGLGFGLQKVVSNLFSGIILLLDRSLKPGDVIEVGNAYGWIEQMGARYATVVTRDGKEYLIPNEDLITQPVINWSYSDTSVRVKIGVGISYRSDVHKAMALMIEAALAQDRVLRDELHMPKAQLVEFGNSSVNFELRFWVSDPQSGVGGLSSDIRLAIWDLFHENGIDFPFPQHDLHIVSAEGLKGIPRELD